MDSAKEDVKNSKTSHMGFQDDGHTAYDLRENPKKSWKFAGLIQNATASMQEPENQCKVCGKQFESLKALYGHMRHHSERERRKIFCKECSKEFLSSKSLANHMRVHSQKVRVRNESRTSSSHYVAVKSLVVKRKRSVRKRYNFTASSSISSFNESLFAAEIDQEVEQAAICLMMLSRGGQNWGEFYAMGEFSNNASVTFEVKALNQKRIVTNESGYFVANGNGTSDMEKRREEKLDACVSESLIVLGGKEEDERIEMDSGAESTEEKRAKLEVSIDSFYKGREFEMPKLDDRTGSESSESEILKEILGDVKFKSTEVESSEDLMEEVLDEAGLGILTSTSSKKVNFHACDTELGGDLITKVTGSDYETLEDSQKTSKIKCKICNKVFCSRRALGGHQRMHSTRKRFIPLKTENSEKQRQTIIFPEIEDSCKLEFVENLTEHEIGGSCAKDYKSREIKEHKCLVCLKVFESGQALGGHKRAHIGKSSETKKCSDDICDELDFNVPIMLQKEANADVGSEPWWVGREHKHEPFLSLVAN